MKRQTTTTQSPTQDESVRAHGIGVKIDPAPAPGTMATFVAYQRQELIDAHAEELEGWRRRRERTGGSDTGAEEARGHALACGVRAGAAGGVLRLLKSALQIKR